MYPSISRRISKATHVYLVQLLIARRPSHVIHHTWHRGSPHDPPRRVIQHLVYRCNLSCAECSRLCPGAYLEGNSRLTGLVSYALPGVPPTSSST